ncbi:MAG TPA: branched-chain amino acid ABC transporter permease [Thermoanaerobaculia bacterium]|nr:branched-chain amino acid ABC transporter permease [Thermoanaerobaculia bacterium]
MNSSYALYTLATILQLGLLAQATDLMAGHVGRIGFGAITGSCVGSYVYAVLATHSQQLLLASVLSVVAASGVGVSVGYVAALWDADRYLLVTFVVQLTVVEVANNAGVTGGPLGIRDVPALGAGPNRDATHTTVLILLTCAAVFTVILEVLTSDRWRFGRRLHWMRDDAPSAIAAGINPFTLHICVSSVQCVIGAVVGISIASVQQYVGPQSFDLWLSLKVITVLILAGPGCAPRYILIAAASIVALTEGASIVFTDPVSAGPIEVALTNLVLIVLLLRWRHGLAGPRLVRGGSDNVD